MAEARVDVYGGFPARPGLTAVSEALSAGFPLAKVYIIDLPGDLGETLHFRTDEAFFATMFMDEEEVFLFDGSVEGSIEDAIGFVGAMSACLTKAGLDHDLHVARGPTEHAASFVHPPV